jgi:predicted acylesterase/phospholipase RssA
MSGGSNDAVWEAGVLWGLAHYGNPSDYYWDAVSGISAGSINTSQTAGWRPEEVLEMTEAMSETYKSLKNTDLFTIRPSLADMNEWHGIADNTPALEFLRGILAERPGFGRRAAVGSLEVNSGEFWEFTPDNTKYEDFAQAAICSASIPVAFEPQHFHGGILVDGGTVWDVNVASAINECRAMTERDEDITIDIVTIARRDPPHQSVGNTRHNRKVAKNIHGTWDSSLNYAVQMKACPRCNYRWIFNHRGKDICPPDLFGLDFNGDHTWCLQLEGREDAQKALDNDHYPQVTEAMFRWIDSPELQAEHPSAIVYAMSFI